MRLHMNFLYFYLAFFPAGTLIKAESYEMFNKSQKV
jgi:hypothetical protein